MNRVRPTIIKNNRNGSTTVEFALVLPILMASLMFFFETWRFAEFQHSVDQASLEGARAAITPGATAADAEARARQILDAVGAITATVTVSPDPIIDTTEEVTVFVAQPYSDVGFFFDYFAPNYVFSSTITLDSENKRMGQQ